MEHNGSVLSLPRHSRRVHIRSGSDLPTSTPAPCDQPWQRPCSPFHNTLVLSHLLTSNNRDLHCLGLHFYFSLTKCHLTAGRGCIMIIAADALSCRIAFTFSFPSLLISSYQSLPLTPHSSSVIAPAWTSPPLPSPSPSQQNTSTRKEATELSQRCRPRRRPCTISAWRTQALQRIPFSGPPLIYDLSTVASSKSTITCSLKLLRTRPLLAMPRNSRRDARPAWSRPTLFGCWFGKVVPWPLSSEHHLFSSLPAQPNLISLEGIRYSTLTDIESAMKKDVTFTESITTNLCNSQSL